MPPGFPAVPGRLEPIDARQHGPRSGSADAVSATGAVKPLRASLWRQKVDVVKGREPKDFGHVVQSVQRLEQILEVSGWGEPEERPGRLVRLVEITVRNPARHTYQITGLGDAPHPIKFQRQLPLLHENKLVLGRVNMDWDELTGIAVGFEREGA